MRVCFFVPTYLPDIGGVSLSTHGLVLALEEAGCSVSVFAPYSRTGDNILDVPLRIRRYRTPRFKGMGSARLLLPLWSEKQKFGFDVLHCHGLDPAGYIGSLFKALTSTPLVVTPSRTKTLIPDEAWHHRPRERRIEKTLAAADRVTAISSLIREILIGRGLSENSVSFIPNGVDVPFFARRRESGFHQPYVLAMGRFRHSKGFDLLISAFDRIKDAFPTVKLVIAGGGKKEQELKSQVGQLRLQDRILFPGLVHGDEKVGLYQNCLFFVLSSRSGQEGCPNVVLEAMAAGRPVVASEVGGARDLICHEENGLLVPPDEPESLAEGLRRMLEDSAQRELMAENARSRARSFDFPEIAKRHIALYQEILTSSGREGKETLRP